MANEGGRQVESFFATNPRDGVRVHGLRWGTGPQHILAIHGVNAHAWHWRRVAERLGPEYSLVSYDLRGHGDSDKPEDGYSYAHQGTDIEALLAHLDWEPVETLILGHSLGARLAVPYVAQHPPLAFVIADSAMITPPRSAPPAGTPPPAAGRARQPLQMEYASREEFMERMAKTNFLRNQHEFNVEYAAQLIGPPAEDGSVRLKLTPAAHQQTMASMMDAELTSYLPKIQCPTLIIRATEGNLSAEAAALMLTEIVDSQLVVIEGSNHNAMLDRPDAFDALLDPFLERIFG